MEIAATFTEEGRRQPLQGSTFPTLNTAPHPIPSHAPKSDDPHRSFQCDDEH